MVTRCSWEEAQTLAKRSPSRGFMPPASAIEIVLPDIGGTYADIQRFACVPLPLKLDYHRARGEAFAYGGDARREKAEDLLDQVLTAWADATLCHGCKCQLSEGEERYCADCIHDGVQSDADALRAFDGFHRFADGAGS